MAVPGGPSRALARPQELQLRWQEYRELVVLLLQWVRHHTAAFEERRFPSSFEEIEVGLASRTGAHTPAAWARRLTPRSPQILWCQFLKFKETELPAKEADKNRSKGIYQSLEVSEGCPRWRGRGHCRGEGDRPWAWSLESLFSQLAWPRG